MYRTKRTAVCYKVLKCVQVCQRVRPEHDYSMASMMLVSRKAIVTVVFCLALVCCTRGKMWLKSKYLLAYQPSPSSTKHHHLSKHGSSHSNRPRSSRASRLHHRRRRRHRCLRPRSIHPTSRREVHASLQPRFSPPLKPLPHCHSRSCVHLWRRGREWEAGRR